MARIAGVTLPQGKPIYIGLTSIYGIGITTSKKILDTAGIEYGTRVRELSDEQVSKLREAIEKSGMKLEGELRRDVLGNIKRLKEIKSYRGSRHERHLPVRGQSTKTNSRTVRGNKRSTMGSGRRTLTKT